MKTGEAQTQDASLLSEFYHPVLGCVRFTGCRTEGQITEIDASMPQCGRPNSAAMILLFCIYTGKE